MKTINGVIYMTEDERLGKSKRAKKNFYREMSNYWQRGYSKLAMQSKNHGRNPKPSSQNEK